MCALYSRAAAWLRQLGQDDYRRHANAHGADIDATFCKFTATAMPLVLACKGGKQPGMLLLGSCAGLTAVAMLLLIKQRRKTYEAYREPLAILGSIPTMLFVATQQSFTSHLHRHGGSAARLALLLAATNPGTWCMIAALSGGIVVAANQLILPALVLMSVWAGNRGMCQQLLQVPGVEPPLGRLHWTASLLHTGMQPPLLWGLDQPPQPMQQCLMVNAWLAAMLGAVLPLFILSQLEAAARQRFYARRRQRGSEAGEQNEPLHDLPMQWSTLYFWSFITWCLADVTYSVPNHLAVHLAK